MSGTLDRRTPVPKTNPSIACLRGSGKNVSGTFLPLAQVTRAEWTIRGGCGLGFVSFLLGFLSPIFLSDSNLGPLLGIVVTGPLGCVVGGLLGFWLAPELEQRFGAGRTERRRRVVVGIGEVLWDVFPDHDSFGGAPANFACVVAKLGKNRVSVLMVSAVGDDQRGERAIAELRARGVDTSLVQRNEHATGEVVVDVSGDEVRYEITSPAAWDAIEWNDELAALARRCHAVCFGSLAQRMDRSRTTIRRFVDATPPTALRVLDVNLRPPHEDRDVVLESLRLANVVKLNDNELATLCAWLSIAAEPPQSLVELARRFELRAIALTRGSRGAILASGNEVSEQEGVAVDVVDPVGAGDAFAAALVDGLLRAKPIAEINQAACEVAARACASRGALG